MQTSTETGAGPLPAERKLIGAAERKGHVLKTWMRGADDFAVEVYRAGELVETVAGETRGRAELVAERLVDEFERQQAEGVLHVAGWQIEVRDHRRDFSVDVSPIDETRADLLPEVPEFKGFRTRSDAIAEVSAWCERNALRVDGEFNDLSFTVYRCGPPLGWTFLVHLPDSAPEPLFDSEMVHPSPAAASRAAQRWCGEFRPGEQLPEDPPVEDEESDAAEPEGAAAVEAVVGAPGSASPATASGPTPEQLAAEADAAIADTSAPAKAVDEPSCSPSRAASTPASALDDDLRDEVWTLLAQRKEVRERKTKVVQGLNLYKAQLKAIDLELEELDQQIEEAYENAPRQRTLPLATAPRAAKSVEQGTVAKEAPKVVEQLLKSGDTPGEFVWPFNGVQHTIVCRELAPGKFRASIKGPLESKTEGFGESAKEAIGNCQDRASIFLADAEPGSITPGSDTGPVADGAAPKRSRRKKLKGKSAKDVIAVLRDSMHVSEAAQTIGCTEAELEEFARDNDIKLSAHLSAGDVEEEKPARRAKKASKRGSKSGSRGKRGGS